MSEDKPSLDEIIRAWKADCGETKQSERGTTYVVIPIPNRYGHFLNLIQTILDHGYDKTTLRSAVLSTKIVMACWSDLITKMTAKELRKARDISRHQWEEALDKFSDVKISKHQDFENIVPSFEPKKEKPLEINPSDRIKMDTSDIVEPEMDLDFLKDLGIDDLSTQNE